MVIITGSVALVAWRNYRAIERDLTHATISRRASIAYLGAFTLGEKLSRLTDLAVSLATRVRFRELVHAGRWDDAIAILRDVPRHFPDIDRVFLADSTGTLMADLPPVPTVHGVNFAYRDWYRGVSRNWTPYVSNAYTRSAAPVANVVAVAAPVRVGGGSIAAILVIQVRLNAIVSWTRSIHIGNGGVVYVVDRRGTVAAHPKLALEGGLRDFSTFPAVERLLRGDAGVDVLFDPLAGEDRLVAYAPISSYGWGVVVQQPTAIAFGGRDRLLRNVWLAYLLIALLALGVIALMARILAEQRSTEAAHRAQGELERRVAERTAELDVAVKELESFSYSVSHDLRAPLRAMDGFSRMIEEDYGPQLDAEGRRRLGVIRRHSRAMGQLIDDLLEFSRLGRKQLVKRPIDMTGLVERACQELQAAGGADLPPLVVPPVLPRALGDPALVAQVWANLLSNAVKFTGKRSDPRIEISGHVDGAEVVYAVKDNGAGFDPAYADKLFGVFQRLHRVDEFPGTGVGLAIVHRVVVRHNGRVWAEGQVDEGATFWFSLPRADGTE